MANYFPGVMAAISTGNGIEHGHPQEVPDHHNHNYTQEHRQLARDGTLPAQAAESAADEERQNGNNDPLYDFEHDVLEFLQKLDHGFAVRPDRCQAHKHAEHQRTHHGHDLGNIQFKNDLGQCVQALDLIRNIQMRNERIPSPGAEQSGQYAGDIGNNQRHAQHTRSVRAQPRDRRCHKAYNDERHTESDDLAHNVLGRNNDFHHAFGQNEAQKDAHYHRKKQLGRQAVQDFFHNTILLFQYYSSIYSI